jgi:glycosidase
VRYWIETFDIDGLRLDSANVLDFDFMNELRRFTEAIKKDFWLMGEVVHGDYGRWINERALHSVTNYELYKSLYSSHNDENLFELAYSMTREFGENGLYRDFTLYNFVDNHDQNRLASIVDNPAYLYTIYILLFTAPGIPSIYYGSEWGVKGEKKDGSDAGIRQYIDIRNVKKDEPDLEGVIKKLAAIRRDSAALRQGDYKQVYIQYKRPFIFERTVQNETIVVAINSSGRTEIVNLSQYRSKFYDMLNDEVIEPRNLAKLSLSPHWGRVLRLEV